MVNAQNARQANSCTKEIAIIKSEDAKTTYLTKYAFLVSLAMSLTKVCASNKQFSIAFKNSIFPQSKSILKAN
jgi:hypothetical protein